MFGKNFKPIRKFFQNSEKFLNILEIFSKHLEKIPNLFGIVFRKLEIFLNIFKFFPNSLETLSNYLAKKYLET